MEKSQKNFVFQVVISILSFFSVALFGSENLTNSGNELNEQKYEELIQKIFQAKPAKPEKEAEAKSKVKSLAQKRGFSEEDNLFLIRTFNEFRQDQGSEIPFLILDLFKKGLGKTKESIALLRELANGEKFGKSAISVLVNWDELGDAKGDAKDRVVQKPAKEELCISISNWEKFATSEKSPQKAVSDPVFRIGGKQGASFDLKHPLGAMQSFSVMLWAKVDLLDPPTALTVFSSDIFTATLYSFYKTLQKEAAHFQISLSMNFSEIGEKPLAGDGPTAVEFFPGGWNLFVFQRDSEQHLFRASLNGKPIFVSKDFFVGHSGLNKQKGIYQAFFPKTCLTNFAFGGNALSGTLSTAASTTLEIDCLRIFSGVIPQDLIEEELKRLNARH